MNKGKVSVLFFVIILLIIGYTAYTKIICNEASNSSSNDVKDQFLIDSWPIQNHQITNSMLPYINNCSSAQPFDYTVANALLSFIETGYKEDSIKVNDLAVLMRILTRMRLDLLAWVASGNYQDPLVSEVHTKFVERLQKAEVTVYPFLNGKYKTADQWLASYSGRGVVITGGANNMRYVAYLLKNLKAVGCNLPVEFVTEDANQLSAEHKATLKNLGARLVYLNKVIDNKQTHFASFGMKLAAMFVSSFREAIVIDCDDVFLRDPELLFDDEGYKATGTLLFFDQPEHLNSYAHRDWLKANLPLPLSERVVNSNMFKGHAREVDSAVVVMDKVRCFFGLLASTRINLRRERDTLYPIFWGDAELWWIGFEMAGVLYSISPYSAHGIGPKNGNEVCGKNMHLGSDGRPFFWNQGFVRTKGENNNELLKFEAFAPDGIVFVTSPSLYCVKGSGAILLSNDELEVIESLIKIWNGTTGFSRW